jgi:hypothetical protein
MGHIGRASRSFIVGDETSLLKDERQRNRANECADSATVIECARNGSPSAEVRPIRAMSMRRSPLRRTCCLQSPRKQLVGGIRNGQIA